MLAQTGGLCRFLPTFWVGSAITLASCGLGQRGDSIMTYEQSPAGEHRQVIVALGCSHAPAPAMPAHFAQAECVLGRGRGPGLRYQHHGTPVAPLKWQPPPVLISVSWTDTDTSGCTS